MLPRQKPLRNNTHRFRNVLGVAMQLQAIEAFVERCVYAAVVFVVFIAVALLIPMTIRRFRATAPPETIHVLSKTVQTAVVAVGAVATASTLGVDLTWLATSAGFAAIVIGLATQQVLHSSSLELQDKVNVCDRVRFQYS